MQPTIALNDYSFDDKGIAYAGDYIPTRRGSSPLSKRLLDLKNKKKDAIKYFVEKMWLVLWNFSQTRLTPYPSSHGPFVFMVVPSSDKDNTETGMHLFVRHCVNRFNDPDTICLDCSNALIRHTSIKKQSTGGARSIENHLKTIQMNPQATSIDWSGFDYDSVRKLAELKGIPENPTSPGRSMTSPPSIILIDDITTSGRSLLACRKILFTAGFVDVALFALLKTK